MRCNFSYEIHISIDVSEFDWKCFQMFYRPLCSSVHLWGEYVSCFLAFQLFFHLPRRFVASYLMFSIFSTRRSLALYRRYCKTKWRHGQVLELARRRSGRPAVNRTHPRSGSLGIYSLLNIELSNVGRLLHLFITLRSSLLIREDFSNFFKHCTLLF